MLYKSHRMISCLIIKYNSTVDRFSLRGSKLEFNVENILECRKLDSEKGIFC